MILSKKLKVLIQNSNEYYENKVNVWKTNWLPKLKSVNSSISENLFRKAQDQIEKKVAEENITVVLKQSTRWAKYITWSIVGGTTFGIFWLSLAKTEEIVIVTGKLEPIEGLIEIKMPTRGVTREILIKEGDKVKKGQPLIYLDTEAIEAKNNALSISKEIN